MRIINVIKIFNSKLDNKRVKFISDVVKPFLHVNKNNLKR